jgi:DUF2956 family protein
MAKYKTSPSKETEQAAMKSAKATQRPGQTKEQTKLIAQGIQKGIEHYKKQQKSKARDLDKKLRTVEKAKQQIQESDSNQSETADLPKTANKTRLPWGLLVLSWLLFLGYFLIK